MNDCTKNLYKHVREYVHSYIIISRLAYESSGFSLGLCVQSAGAYTHAHSILVVILVIGAVVVMVGAVGVAIIVISRFWLQCCASSLAAPPVPDSLHGVEHGSPAAHAATSPQPLAHRTR